MKSEEEFVESLEKNYLLRSVCISFMNGTKPAGKEFVCRKFTT